jgi:hypothetical protein
MVNELIKPFDNAEYIGEGRSRIVWARSKYTVIKIPKNRNGYSDNYNEAAIYNKFGPEPDINGIYYANCRLHNNGWLIMSRVIPPTSFANLPKWTDYIDCIQVGFTVISNKLVAYDYAMNR